MSPIAATTILVGAWFFLGDAASGLEAAKENVEADPGWVPDVPPGSQSDASISQLIEDLELCFLQPGGPMTPMQVHVLGLGNVSVWELCCKGSSVSGLKLTMDPISSDTSWAGDSTFHLELGKVQTHCNAKWSYSSYNGTMDLGLGTAAASPFIDLTVALSGEPVVATDATYPFPGKVSKVDCETDLELSALSFAGDMPGWMRVLLNAGASIAKTFQGPFRSIVCSMVRSQMPDTLNQALAQARTLAEPLLQDIADDLGPPAAPEGAGVAYDLRSVKPVHFLHSLAGQALETGGIMDLVKRVTGGSDAAELQMGASGLKVAEVNTTVPADLQLTAWVTEVGLQGVGSIHQLDIDADDSQTMLVNLGQKHLNVSTKIRTLTLANADLSGGVGLDAEEELKSKEQDSKSRSNDSNNKQETSSSSSKERRASTAALTASIVEYLVENFELRLFLSDLSLLTKVGVLVDKNQTDYLVAGSSWYSNECLPTMIQNASVTHIDLNVVVNQFRFDSQVKSPDQLERDFDSCVNSVLGYLNTPQMRPVITRLVKSVAAGQARDMGNVVIQQMLGESRPPCTSEEGFGHTGLYFVLVVIGFILVCMAILGLIVRVSCHTSITAAGRRFGAVLAFAAICFVLGGSLGRPFAAVVRLHDGQVSTGGADRDTLCNMYVVDPMDLVKNMPGTIAVLAMSTLFWGSKMTGVVVLALRNPATSRVPTFVRISTAVGGWGICMVYMLAVPQVISFYARILQFGDTWADMGVSLRNTFYIIPIAFLIGDIASLVVYRSCQAARLDRVKYEEPPKLWVLVALGVSLLLLVISPCLTLWTHYYHGVVGTVIHYQNGGAVREITLWTVLTGTPGMLADPWRIGGMGAFIVMSIVVVNLILAPVVNAALSLYVGIQLKLHRSGGTIHDACDEDGMPSGWVNNSLGVEPSVQLMSAQASNSRSASSASASGTAGARLSMDLAGSAAGAGLSVGPTSGPAAPAALSVAGPPSQTAGAAAAGASSSSNASNTTNAGAAAGNARAKSAATAAAASDYAWRHPWTRKRADRLAWTLVLARMWSGADAFALFMAVIVPELGNQLIFMSDQACDPLDPVLHEVGQECNTLHSSLNFGLFLFLFAGLAARILSEFAAHGPLRGTLHSGRTAAASMSAPMSNPDPRTPMLEQ